MPRHEKSHWYIYAALAVICALYFAVEAQLLYARDFNNLLINQKDTASQLTKTASYVAISFVTVLASFGMFFSNRGAVRIAAYFLCLFVLLDHFTQQVLGSRITIDIILMAASEYRFAGTAAHQFMMQLLFAGTAFVLIIVVNEKLLRRLHVVSLPVTAVLLLVGLSGGLFLLVKTDGRRDAFIASLRVPVQVGYLFYKHEKFGLFLPYQKRELDPAVHPLSAPADKLVFIVDESITGNYMFQSHDGKEVTPFLERFRPQIADFGCASAVANSSRNAQYVLRTGLRPEALPDTAHVSLAAPSIFTFAKRAGYLTVLIDTQMKSTTSLHNFTSIYDLEDIDQYIVADLGTSIFDRDHATIPVLAQLLSSDQKVFIWLVKTGAHFVYNQRYPRSQAVFLPDDYGSAAHDDLQSIIFGAKEKILNSYMNAIRWNVDAFFEHLIELIDIDDVTIIYTSDHGQSIDGSSNATHGQLWDAPMIQGSVPLMVFGKAVAEKFNHAIATGIYSQFQIFPTLLSLMGYDATVVDSYGTPLWEGPFKARARFFSGSVFSDQLIWNDFDLPCNLDFPERQ